MNLNLKLGDGMVSAGRSNNHEGSGVNIKVTPQGLSIGGNGVHIAN